VLWKKKNQKDAKARQQLHHGMIYIIFIILLDNFVAHNHAPQASNTNVARAITEIKKQARNNMY
jgi:hypothetical protein